MRHVLMYGNIGSAHDAMSSSHRQSLCHDEDILMNWFLTAIEMGETICSVKNRAHICTWLLQTCSLAQHISTHVVPSCCLFRTSRPSRRAALGIVGPLLPTTQQEMSTPLTPFLILITILSPMVDGMLCVRSLRYQFYAYIAWAAPYLLWTSGMHPVLIFVI